MDLDMPRLDGIEATRRIIAERPRAAVLVLTAFSDRPRILGALEAGACGYLLKAVASDEVAEGIRAAARGESPLDPRAARTVLTARAGPDPLEALSPREPEGPRPRPAGARGARPAARGPAEQADRAAARDHREDGEVAPDAGLPRDRRHRPHPGRALGRAPRAGPRRTAARVTRRPCPPGRSRSARRGSAGDGR